MLVPNNCSAHDMERDQKSNFFNRWYRFVSFNAGENSLQTKTVSETSRYSDVVSCRHLKFTSVFEMLTFCGSNCVTTVVLSITSFIVAPYFVSLFD